MTKYILNLGGLKSQPDKAKQFFAEVVDGLGRGPDILFCFFARVREVWEEKFVEYVKNFQNSLTDKINPSFELALPNIFKEQVNKADLIIIYGGDDHLLQFWLKQYDIPKIWQGKTVAASSAGSAALVKHFWTCDWRQCMDGLGILPIKFIPHYGSEYGKNDPRGPINWQKAYHDLEQFGDPDLPIYAPKEGEFVVIKK